MTGQLMESFEGIQGAIDYIANNRSWIVPLIVAIIVISIIFKVIIIVKTIFVIPGLIAKLIAFIFSKKGIITIGIIVIISLIIYYQSR